MIKCSLLGIFLAGALWLILVRSLDFQKLLEILHQFSLWHIITLLLISSVIVLCKIWRFYILLQNSEVTITFWQTSKAFIASQSTTALPGGEATRGVILAKEITEPFAKTTGVVLTQAFLEVICALTIALIGSLFFPVFLGAYLIVGGIIACIVVLLLHPVLLPSLMKRLNHVPWIKAHSFKLTSTQKLLRITLFDKKFSLPRQSFMRAFGVGILSNIVGGLLIYMIAHFLQIEHLTLIKSVFIYASSIVVQSIGGISPGGLGFTEGALTGLLLAFALTVNQIVAFILIFRAVTLVFSLLIGLGFIGIFYRKI